ncbi:MAG TPA: AbrB/MazE/SpoVT family DNA-binding domain-containing protein [Candidatus Wunengus sp. YC61]
MTSKGQITLPKEVSKLLNVQERNVIVFEKENDKIVSNQPQPFVTSKVY